MGCTVLQLEVLCENTAAVRLYEKLGFAAAAVSRAFSAMRTARLPTPF